MRLARGSQTALHRIKGSFPAADARGMFDPDADAILPVDECWLVDPRVLAQRVATSDVPAVFEQSYATAVDKMAAAGYGCVPDPGAGDAAPASFAATCIVYRAADGGIRRTPDLARELHLRLTCAMARTDGAFVGSELAVALELADRLGVEDEPLRLRLRATVRELFMNTSLVRDPMAELVAMPRAAAVELVSTLRAMAWADGYLRSAEQRMLVRVHELLELPADHGDLAAGRGPSATRYVDDDVDLAA